MKNNDIEGKEKMNLQNKWQKQVKIHMKQKKQDLK